MSANRVHAVHVVEPERARHLRIRRNEVKAPPLRQLLPAAIEELAAVRHLSRAREVHREAGERDDRAHTAEGVLDAPVVRVVQGAGGDRECRGSRRDDVDLAVEVELARLLAFGAVLQVLQLVIEEEIELRAKPVKRGFRRLALKSEAGREKGLPLRLPGARAAREQESRDQERGDSPGGQFGTSGRTPGAEAGSGPRRG